MKAVTRKRYGLPDVLTIAEVEQPLPSPDEVLVRVHATTVSRTDYHNLTGRPGDHLEHLYLELSTRFGRGKRVMIPFPRIRPAERR